MRKSLSNEDMSDIWNQMRELARQYDVTVITAKAKAPRRANIDRMPRILTTGVPEIIIVDYIS